MKTKNLNAAGTTKVFPKAPDKKGDYVTIQRRTLQNKKSGGKIKKK